MADDRKSSEPERDIEMEELREEIARLKEAVGDRLLEAREAINERAAVIRENPATFTVTMFVGGAIGLLIGLALGRSEEPARWYDRYR